MKILSGLIFGAMFLSGLQLLAPFSALAAGSSPEFSPRPQQQVETSASLITSAYSAARQTPSDDYDPPNTGGPARSGGSGTR